MSVFVYDATDHPLDWLADRGVRVTHGVPMVSTGHNRPKWDPGELVAAAKGHDALLGASGALIGRSVMEALPDLRCIAKLGIGYEVIDIDAATDLGIMVATTPVHSEVDSVAEHAIALMLGLGKRLHHYGARYIAEGRWKAPDLMSLSVKGSTVGIVGFGAIGRAVAVRLGGWGAHILAYDVRSVDPVPGVEFTDLESLLARSDIVTLHAPGRAPGQGPLLDAWNLSRLKPGALLVNTARGNLVDQREIAAMLEDGRLHGFAADVYNPEPPSRDDPILRAPNTLLTPHCAAWSPDLRREMVEMAMESLWAMLHHTTPQSLVNPAAMDRGRNAHVRPE